MIVLSAQHLLRRAAATYWAVAAGAHVPDAIRFFDSMPKWSAMEFAKKYPIVLDKTPEGLIDASALNDSDIAGTLQRALMLDTMGEIAEATTWGGDDNWFDYLPNGIGQLVSLQSEDWATCWAEIWNTHPWGIEDEEESHKASFGDDENDSVEEKIAERYGFFLQDVTSGFIPYFMIPR